MIEFMAGIIVGMIVVVVIALACAAGEKYENTSDDSK